jgi:hypothetical protein
MHPRRHVADRQQQSQQGREDRRVGEREHRQAKKCRWHGGTFFSGSDNCYGCLDATIRQVAILFLDAI